MLRYMKISLISLVSTSFLAGLVQADCPAGDLNGDCVVDFFDFAMLAENWAEEEPNFTLRVGSVVINEVMAHSHAEAPDWIELYNTTGCAVNIGGWHLSDSDRELTTSESYEILNGTTIPAYGYIVFYETNFGTKFKLSENSDQVYLSLHRDGVPFVMDDRKFGASETGVSFGLYTTSTGDVKFVAMDSNTPGGLNDYPKVGPIVISEIMYNHATYGTNGEYIELHNIENNSVPLWVYDPCIAKDVNWKLTEGPNFTFPPHTTIPANGYLIVARDPENFNDKYGDPGVQVLGPFEDDTKLSNAGENVEISMPGDLDPCDPNIRYYIRIDNVRYSDGSQHEDFPGLDPWPRDADGGGDGYSLQRINSNLYGDDVANWKADEPTPGH